MSKLLPWIEVEVLKIRSMDITINEKLNLLFKKVPGICRFKAEQLSNEAKKSYLTTFQLRPSILEIKRKLNRGRGRNEIRK